jgi:hypothetical protein
MLYHYKSKTQSFAENRDLTQESFNNAKKTSILSEKITFFIQRNYMEIVIISTTQS